jgi:hypothetical protein
MLELVVVDLVGPVEVLVDLVDVDFVGPGGGLGRGRRAGARRRGRGVECILNHRADQPEIRVAGVDVLGRERQRSDARALDPPDQLHPRGQIVGGDVGRDVVLGDLGQRGVLLEHRDWVDLVEDLADEAALAAHPVVVIAG